MLFTFLKKQKERRKKIELIKTMIMSLNIPEDQKEIFIKSLDVIDVQNLDNLYLSITQFVEKIEIRELADTQKENFVIVAGMSHKEAKEKQKEVNAFSFLLNNI